MRIKILCFAFVGVILIVTGCQEIAQNNVFTETITEEITFQLTPEQVSEPRNTLIYITPTPSAVPTATPNVQLSEAIPLDYVNVEEFTELLNHTDEGVVYENSKHDFSLTFPSYWENSFLIYGDDLIKVSFIGKSKTSQKIIDNKNFGLSLFMIVPEYRLENILIYDDAEIIGTTNGVKYYYVTYTDCEICSLEDELEYYEKGRSFYQDDAKEIELVRQDLEQYSKMRYDIEAILSSFQAFSSN